MKHYEKPSIFFESYHLSQNVAVCGWDATLKGDVPDCVATWDPKLDNTGNNFGVVLFVSNTACTVKPDDRNDYCYTVGTGANGLFQS